MNSETLVKRLLNSYESLIYPGYPFVETHPDRLAAIAILYGLNPQPPEQSQILELGCGCGENLIPLAVTLPQSFHLGLDFSAKHIDEAKKRSTAAGLRNIEFRTKDIREISFGEEKFDYIICHGVYSWVPHDVQDKILEICSEHLSAQGLAYISYNTLPGWHSKLIARDLMLCQPWPAAHEAARINRARNLLEFAASATKQLDVKYHQLLSLEFQAVKDKPDWFVAHEHLEVINEPLYFHHFIRKIRDFGLSYVGDARFSTMFASNLPQTVREGLERFAGTRLEVEQYLDFVRNRSFRRSILCRQELELEDAPRAQYVDRLSAAASLSATEHLFNLLSSDPIEFSNSQGLSLSVTVPLLKSALLVLGDKWPAWIPFHQLLEDARRKLAAPAAPDPRTFPADAALLRDALLENYRRKLIELHTVPPPQISSIPQFPKISPYARWQAQHGQTITNLRLEPVALPAWQNQLLSFFDGSREQSSLLAAVQEQLQHGSLEQALPAVPADSTGQKAAASQLLEKLLGALRRNALLLKE